MKTNILNNKSMDDRVMYLIITILSTMIFISIYGIKVLNPTYTDWLLAGGDLSQHYLGWVAYRNSDWMFPIGMSDLLSYPTHSSIIFTDSIPLFAVTFKIFKSVLPMNFQYFGIWGVMCFILQGVISAKILKNYCEDKIVIIVASILLVYTPVMIWRMYAHTALAGHWIILLGLEILFLNDKYINSRQIYYKVVLLAALSSTVHIYFLLMNGIILAGVCLADILKTKKIKKSVTLLLCYVVTAGIIIFLLGGFTSSTAGPEPGLTSFSYNLNSMLNPQGWSSIYKDLPLRWGQYEGFAYLGAGCILILVFTGITLLAGDSSKKLIKDNKYNIIAITIVFVVAFFLALSPVVTFGEHVLIEYRLPTSIFNLWSIFRATGRLIWISVYILLFSGLIITFKICNKKTFTILISFSLLLQMYDLHNHFRETYSYFSQTYTYNSELRDTEFWEMIGNDDDIKRIILTNPNSFSTNGISNNEIYSLADWALDSNKTLNTFYFARTSEDEVKNRIEETLLNPTLEYIFIFNDANRNKCFDYDLNYYKIDNFIIGYKGTFDGYAPMTKSDFYPTYEIGTDILFYGDGYNANKYVLSGIYNREAEHTWTEGKEVNLQMRIDSDAEKLNCVIELLTVFNDKQDVTVLINGEEVYSNEVCNGQNIEFEFNNNSEDSIYDIQILIPNAMSPKELGMSDDARVLGLAIKKIAFN